MKQYEGLFMLLPPADDQTLEAKLETIRSEITQRGGTVEAMTRMGRIPFARPLKKKDSGTYVLITLSMDPRQLASLRERYKLNEDIMRVQIVLATHPAKDSPKPVEQHATISR